MEKWASVRCQKNPFFWSDNDKDLKPVFAWYDSAGTEGMTMTDWFEGKVPEDLFPEQSIDVQMLENKVKEHIATETGRDRLREMYVLMDETYVYEISCLFFFSILIVSF